MGIIVPAGSLGKSKKGAQRLLEPGLEEVKERYVRYQMWSDIAGESAER